LFIGRAQLYPRLIEIRLPLPDLVGLPGIDGRRVEQALVVDPPLSRL
jgi:hypothetical protein